MRTKLVNKLIKLIGRTPDATVGNTNAWYLVPYAVAAKTDKLKVSIVLMNPKLDRDDPKQAYLIYTL